MIELIKIAELDIGVDRVTKSSIKAQISLEKLKLELSNVKKQQKEGIRETIKQEAELKKLADSGKSTTKEYKDLEKSTAVLNTSLSTQSEKIVSLNTQIKNESREYRNQTKIIQAFKKVQQESLGIVTKTDGSIRQISAALSNNKKVYFELTAEQRNNDKVGGELLKTIKEQDEEYKNLNKSIGNNQVDVGNYSNAIRSVAGEFSILKKVQQENLGIVTKTDGSIRQISAALSKNKKVYSELTAEQRNNDKVGGELLKTIKEQDEEYKNLNKSIGNNQVDAGNYSNAIRSVAGEFRILGVSVFGVIDKIKKTIAGFIGLRVASKASGASVRFFSKALKILRIAILGTGIGLLVVAFGSLISYLSTTQSGINKLRRVTIPLRVLFDSIVGVMQNLGEAIFNAFSDPKKAIKNFSKFLISNFVNRIKGIGVLFEALSKIIKSGFTSGYTELADATIQIGIGVEKATDKATDAVKNLGDEYDKAKERGDRIAEITERLSREEATFLKVTKEANLEYEKQNGIAEDNNNTLEERLLGLDKSIKAITKEKEAIKERNDLEVESLRLEQQSNDTLDEERAELQLKINELLEAGIKFETRLVTQKTKRFAITQQVAKEEINASKTRLALFIEETKKNIRSQKGELERAEFIKDKKLQLIKDEVSAGVKTADEGRLDELKAEASFADEVSRLIIEESSKKLKLIISGNASELEQGELLNKQIIQKELERISIIADARKTDLKVRLEEGKISQNEFNESINEINVENEAKKLEISNSFREQENDAILVNQENRRAILEEGSILDIEQRLIQIEELRAKEVEEAGNIGADIDLVHKKYDKIERDTEKEKRDFKTKQRSGYLSTIKQLAGEESAIGKAAVVADIINITVARATDAFALANTYFAAQLIPQGINASIQGGLIIAAGVSNVAKIVSPKLEKGGLVKVGGNLHSDGGTQFVGSDGTVFEAERDELIGVMSRKASRSFMDFNNEFTNNSGGYSNYLATGGIIERAGGQSISTSTPFDYDILSAKLVESFEAMPSPVVSVEQITESQNTQYEVDLKAQGV